MHAFFLTLAFQCTLIKQKPKKIRNVWKNLRFPGTGDLKECYYIALAELFDHSYQCRF